MGSGNWVEGVVRGGDGEIAGGGEGAEGWWRSWDAEWMERDGTPIPARRPWRAVRSGRPIPDVRRTGPGGVTPSRCSVIHCLACAGRGGQACSRSVRRRPSRHSRSRLCDTPTPLGSGFLLALRWWGKAQSGACVAEGAPDGLASYCEPLLGCRRT